MKNDALSARGRRGPASAEASRLDGRAAGATLVFAEGDVPGAASRSTGFRLCGDGAARRRVKVAPLVFAELGAQ